MTAATTDPLRAFPATAAAAADPAGTHRPPLRFTWAEASGSLGDLGTFLPITVALCITCGLDLAVVLCGAGLMNVVSGWVFRQPVAVQPMKAIAAVAIATGASSATVAVAGLMVGLAVLGLGLLSGADRLARSVPEPVVRGLQLGVGLKLAWSGLTMAGGLPAGQWGWVGASAALLLIGAATAWGRRVPWLLLLVAAGLAVAMATSPGAWRGFSGLPSFGVSWPTADWSHAALGLGAAQLPLTLLNSVLAVCLLSGELYPTHPVTPRRMATAVGMMNLLAVPFGAMPMCHGAGGLAAQHALGARTGGSVVMLGLVKIAAGLTLGAGAAAALLAFPGGILAPLLVLSGLRLTWHGTRLPGDRPSAFTAAATAAAAVIASLTLPAVACLTLSQRPTRRSTPDPLRHGRPGPPHMWPRRRTL